MKVYYYWEKGDLYERTFSEKKAQLFWKYPLFITKLSGVQSPSVVRVRIPLLLFHLTELFHWTFTACRAGNQRSSQPVNRFSITKTFFCVFVDHEKFLIYITNQVWNDSLFLLLSVVVYHKYTSKLVECCAIQSVPGRTRPNSLKVVWWQLR